MSPVARIAGLGAALLALGTGCSRMPDPAQLTAVDQLITATDGALLTLNELDLRRYQRTDSLFAVQQDAFAMRFTDTLGRREAQALGNQFIALRAARAMGADHLRLQAALGTSRERLRTLRNDLASGAISTGHGAGLIAHEQRLHAVHIAATHAVMDNYRLLQKAWDRRDTVQVMLAQAPRP